MSYMDSSNLSLDSFWNDIKSDKNEVKIRAGLADINSDMAATRQAPSAELPVFEYCEKARTCKSRCPVYRAGTTPEGGAVYTAYVSGQITEVDNYITLIDILMTMQPTDAMYIFIDSPGGYISSGGLIASAIDSCSGRVFTIARGLCASAAALIHSSARRGMASVTPFAVMLYHMSSHNDEGVSTRIEQAAAKQVRYVNETLLSKALADGHITKEEFERIQTGEDIMIPASEWVKRTQNQGGTNE